MKHQASMNHGVMDIKFYTACPDVSKQIGITMSAIPIILVNR
jgi:hypothetical protein